MKIHLIRKQTIENFTAANVQSKSALAKWLSIIKWVDWNEPNDIFSTFNSADILGESSKRVVFNLGGNKYRMICSYHFGKKKVHLFVKWIGIHSEYSKLCAYGKQYTIDAY
ncbi:MAG: type II toxin-antitoxin system HigB family toxin [Melioribacteraceae bacterium]|nr:type II toxin-antitoxin system HigB family toxin [Melioribacteraceae bacterium]MCF8395079.1 type II toxin-antitoxin system HigB family toxin [Melioribacteraceae bacterium]MCF8420374.1 type II toxin-antitoxin system HigB family toxin [Melioribacteraceae bacterium]